MKSKYIKPEVKVEDITLTNAITALTVSTGKIADYDNVEQNTWDEWSSLFQ